MTALIAPPSPTLAAVIVVGSILLLGFLLTISERKRSR